MKRETLERILSSRGAKKKGKALDVPEGEVATLMVGGEPSRPLPGIVAFVLDDDVLQAVTRKEAHTYVEYDAVTAVTFEPKELADRRTGF
jgi:hypothetical protein